MSIAVAGAVKAKRFDKDVYQLIDASDALVGFAMRLSNDRWIGRTPMEDGHPEGRRVGFSKDKPKDVAATYVDALRAARMLRDPH